MIPNTYESWKRCITEDCKIALTVDFVDKRITIYSNADHPETLKFVQRYGLAHQQNVLQWLQQARLEIKSFKNF